MSATLHHRIAKTGTLVGVELVAHKTEAANINIVMGVSVQFQENPNENKQEYYDPAAGQAQVGHYQGVIDVAGVMNFMLSNWRWLKYVMGTDAMDEVQLSTSTGTFSTVDLVTASPSGATFTPSAVGGVNPDVVLTTGVITGILTTSDTLLQAVSGATSDVKAFIHDVTFGDDPTSLTVEEIYDDFVSPESEKYLGMRINEATMSAIRGDAISVDLDLVGVSDETETSSVGTRAATSDTPWIWALGSVTIDNIDYDNVCDNMVLTITRNVDAIGGMNRNADIALAGNYRMALTLEMDLPSSAFRTLRRGITTVSGTLTFINVITAKQATLTLTGLQVMGEPRDVSRDNLTVRSTVDMETGVMTGRIYSPIFDFDVA